MKSVPAIVLAAALEWRNGPLKLVLSEMLCRKGEQVVS